MSDTKSNECEKSIFDPEVSVASALRSDSRKWQREVNRLRSMSVVEMCGENLNVKHHVEEWERRCLKAEERLEEAKKKIEELENLVLEANENSEERDLST